MGRDEDPDCSAYASHLIKNLTKQRVIPFAWSNFKIILTNIYSELALSFSEKLSIFPRPPVQISPIL